MPLSTNTKSNGSNSNMNRLLQNLESSAKQQQQQQQQKQIQLNDSNTSKPKFNSSTSTSNKLSSSSSTNNFTSSNGSNKKDLDLSPNSYSNNNNNNTTNNNYKKFNGNGNGNGYHNYDSSNESCFNSITADTLKDDFDFEKNLALFDKDAFYEEMEGQPRPFKSNNSEDESGSIFKKLVNGSLNNPNNHNGNNNNNNSINISNYNNNNSNNSSFTHSSTHKYHQISVANLFSSSSMSLPPSLHSETTSSSTTSYQTKSHGTTNGNNKNYRYDEMVLDTGEPIDMHQIKIGSISPSSYTKTYVTDDGFVVPCIEPELRERLFEQSYKLGLTKERQIECMGRCCTEMALQLVGGPIRFSPKNNHQKPSILVLATSESLQSSYALCTARLLSIRSVRIYLYVNENIVNNYNNINTHQSNNQLFQNELNLLLSNRDGDSWIKKIDNVDDIKNLNSIDLIINGLSDSRCEKQQWYRQLSRHISNLKASVLTVDPSKEYGSNQIKSKWSIVPVMPMDMNEQSCGRIYLCDLGFTKNMFQSVNIKYKSPFGAKFLIPLHND